MKWNRIQTAMIEMRQFRITEDLFDYKSNEL